MSRFRTVLRLGCDRQTGESHFRSAAIRGGWVVRPGFEIERRRLPISIIPDRITILIDSHRLKCPIDRGVKYHRTGSAVTQVERAIVSDDRIDWWILVWEILEVYGAGVEHAAHAAQIPDDFRVPIVLPGNGQIIPRTEDDLTRGQNFCCCVTNLQLQALAACGVVKIHMERVF